MKAVREAPKKVEPRGIYAAVITPRRPGEVEVDLGAMLEVIDFVSTRGADGIALFGAAGEFVHFTSEERSRFIGLATKRSRVPVLANVSHSTLDGAVAMAEEAAGAGVAGVLVMPPYFYRYEGGVIREFYLQLADAVGKWTSVYLYNLPLFTNAIAIDAAEELLRSGQFAGIMDAGGDWEYFERLLALRAERPLTILCGEDRLFARARRAGADGSLSSVAAAVPELMAALCRAIDSGHEDAAARLEARVAEFIGKLDGFPAPAGIREAAAVRGIKAGGPAIPWNGEGTRLAEEFRHWFREWVRVVEHECKNMAG